MLSDQELHEIRQNLERERTRLLRKVEVRTEQDEGDREELNPDRTDLASDYIGRDRRSALLSIELDMLHQIEDALARLDDGSYGTCQECGKAIDPDRLMALPYAEFCMACQQHALEREHRH